MEICSFLHTYINIDGNLMLFDVTFLYFFQTAVDVKTRDICFSQMINDKW